jgi:hypothetical protein
LRQWGFHPTAAFLLAQSTPTQRSLRKQEMELPMLAIVFGIFFLCFYLLIAAFVSQGKKH